MGIYFRGEQPSYSVNPMNLARDELSNLKGLDPLKYARLAARLVTPGQLGGPCPPPSFMGEPLSIFTMFLVFLELVLEEGTNLWSTL